MKEKKKQKIVFWLIWLIVLIVNITILEISEDLSKNTYATISYITAYITSFIIFNCYNELISKNK